MKRRRLGKDGPEVSAIGFGAMSFAGFFGETDEEASFSCMDALIDAGIDFWDTANVYGMGRSERVIGAYLAQKKPQVVLATKVGFDRGPPRGFNNEAGYMRRELEGSLERLGQDRVELYYVHRREQARPVEEVVETLAGFVEEGVIGGYGLSEISPTTLRRAHAVHPCMAVQNEYSLWSRVPDLGLIRTCAELDVAFVPFSPLARGFLSERSVGPEDFAEGDFRASIPRFQAPNYSENVRAVQPFRAFCRSRGWTVGAAAIAWCLGQGDHIIPIPGTRTAAHLAEWADADQIAFTDEDRDEIERLLPAGWAWGDRYSDDQAVGPERYC